MRVPHRQGSQIIVPLAVLLLLCPSAARASLQPDVRQDSANPTGLVARGGEDCGANCLYALARLMGRTVSLTEVRAALPGTPGKGCSLQEIAAAGESFGLTLEARRLSDGEILSAPLPYVLHLDFTDDGGMGHFVVVYLTDPGGTIGYIDGTSGNSFRRNLKAFRAHVSGFALVPKQSNASHIALIAIPVMAVVIGVALGLRTPKSRKA